jgi:23S rRNA (uridine2552-2'-O)-methyltransferase
VAYQRKDSWYRRAKREGYRSRSAYKLIELQRRCRLFSRGMRVVDLGCAPGGWLQVAANEVGAKGRVAGIDRLEVEPLGLPQAAVLVGNIHDPEACDRLREALGGRADVVLSDMAPDTSGVGHADHAGSMELARAAFEAAGRLLLPGGALVCKVFDGPDLNDLILDWKPAFGKVRRIRPESTRKGSRELYLVARPFERG